MCTIGLLGGTFNPIHFGHLRMAQELAESLHFDELRLIPSANPPHKPSPQVSAENRAAMLQLAIQNHPLFKLDARELARTGASFTVDTLESLRVELGNAVSLVLIMGSDAFTKFNTWHRWQEIIKLSHIALVQRPHMAEKTPFPKELQAFLHDHYTENLADLCDSSAGYVTMQVIPTLQISSTAIRHALQKGHSARYLLPDAVLAYIAEHGLYQTNAT